MKLRAISKGKLTAAFVATVITATATAYSCGYRHGGISAINAGVANGDLVRLTPCDKEINNAREQTKDILNTFLLKMSGKSPDYVFTDNENITALHSITTWHQNNALTADNLKALNQSIENLKSIIKLFNNKNVDKECNNHAVLNNTNIILQSLINLSRSWLYAVLEHPERHMVEEKDLEQAANAFGLNFDAFKQFFQDEQAIQKLKDGIPKEPDLRV